MSERIEGIKEWLGHARVWDSNALGGAVEHIAFLLAEVERLERERAEVSEALSVQIEWVGNLPALVRERLARAWDKGYNKGREDGRNDRMFLSSTPREPNSSRNPYRHRPESGTLSE